jgi:hypothetical protein
VTKFNPAQQSSVTVGEHTETSKRTAHTQTVIYKIESTWWRVKASLNLYNHTGDYMYHLAHYMFPAKCRIENIVQFTKYIGIVVTMDWTIEAPHHTFPVAPPHIFVHSPPETGKICGTTYNITTTDHIYLDKKVNDVWRETKIWLPSICGLQY